MSGAGGPPEVSYFNDLPGATFGTVKRYRSDGLEEEMPPGRMATVTLRADVPIAPEVALRGAVRVEVPDLGLTFYLGITCCEGALAIEPVVLDAVASVVCEGTVVESPMAAGVLPSEHHTGVLAGAVFHFRAPAPPAGEV